MTSPRRPHAATRNEVDRGSFRDYRGRVYRRDQRIFRTVAPVAAAEFDQVDASGVISRLEAEGLLLPSVKVDREILGEAGRAAAYVVEHPRIEFISYPYEWSFSALKTAALLQLEITLVALDCGVTLSDATPYNIQFRGHAPVFIDRLSFIAYRDGDYWQGHRQFCEQYLNPLLLTAKLGIPFNSWFRGSVSGILSRDLYRLLPVSKRFGFQTFMHLTLPELLGNRVSGKRARTVRERAPFPLDALRRLLRGLKRWVAGLQPRGMAATTWSDYARDNSYTNREAEQKLGFVRRCIERLQPRTVWDLGCNTGEYSVAALRAGAGSVIGFDSDMGALEQAFARARRDKLDFLPLHMDVANPSPDQGWDQSERSGLAARGKPDAVVALALVHHLALAGNVPLDYVVRWIVQRAPAGIVEFVPVDDPMAQSMLALRDVVAEGYDEASFLDSLRAGAGIIETERMAESGRLLVCYGPSSP